MKRTAGAFLVLAGLGGCTTTADKQDPLNNSFGQASKMRAVPRAQGPGGGPVAAVGYTTPKSDSGVVAANYVSASPTSGVIQASCPDCDANGVSAGGLGHGGLKGGFGQGGHGGGILGAGHDGPLLGHTLLKHKGNGGGGANFGGPDVYRPGQGILPVPSMGPAGAVAATGALPAYGPGGILNARTSVKFTTPEAMKVTWVGPTGLSESSLDTPFRYNFLQGGIYRLKLSAIPKQPGLELYPTLQVEPATQETLKFLAHSSVPVGFSEEDFEQVVAGNYLEKVIYLPNPIFQDVTLGLGEIVSTRLEPGVSAVEEAMKRGTILVVIRMGNIDLQAPNTPAVDAPSPFGMPAGPPAMGMPRPPLPLPAQVAPLGMMPEMSPMVQPAGGMMAQPTPVMAKPVSSPVKPTSAPVIKSGNVLP